MKKFLLTLLTLFMAGSLCAEEYFYMDNIQVTKNFLAQSGAKKRRADIPVKASFDARVNGWQVDLTLPTGVTLRNGVEGADMTIHTLDAVGNDKNIPVTLSSNLENCRFIGANSGAGYYYPEGSDPDEDDPVTCGAAKWEPGVYEQMFVITLEFDQDFTGGEITVTTRTSAGADPRGNITDANADPRIKTCTVTVVDDETLTLDPAEKEATVGEAIDVTVTCADDATIAYSGASVTTTDNGFEITSDEVGEFTVTATATFGVKDETFGYTVRNGVNYVYLPITAEGTYTFKEEAQQEQTAKPSVTYSENNGEITVWAYGVSDDGVEYTLYCDGVEYTGDMPITYDIYEGYNHVWTATAQAPGKTVSELSDECTINIAAQQKPLAPEATLVTDEGETQVTVNFTPATGTTVSTVKVGEQTVTLPYAIDRPAYGEDPIEVEFEVTVTGDNYTTNTYTVKVTVQPVSTPPTPVETTTFVKVTSTDQLVAGKKYILVADTYAMGEVGQTAPGVAVTVNGDEVEAPETVTILTFGESLTQFGATYWPIQLPNGQYLACGGNGKFKTNASATSTYDMWKVGTAFNITDGDYGYPVRMNRNNVFSPTSTTSDMTMAYLYVEKSTEPEKPEFEGTASVVFNENVATLTYTSNDPDATVVVKVDGTEKTVEWTKNEETGEYTATYTVEKSDVPGEYSVTVALTVTPSDNYTGEEVSNSATYTYTILEKTEKPVITYENGENGVVVTATGNGTIILYVDDQQVATGEGTATYTIPYGTDPEEVGVSATAQESGKDVSDYALEDVVVPGVFTATASVEFNDNVATLTYTTNDEDATVTVKVDDVETTVEWNNGQATYTVEKSTTPGEHSVTVELTVAPGDLFYGEPVEASDTYTYTVEKPELAGDITISDVDQEDGTFTVTYDGDENPTLTVVVEDKDGNKTTLEPNADGTYTLPAEGTYDITVTATAEGYKDKEKTAEDVEWTKPVVEVTPTPEITVTRDAEKYTVKATGDGTVTLNIDGKTYDLRGEQSVDLLREDKDYKVTATATAKDGDKLESEAATKDVIVKALVNQPEKPEVTVTPNRNPETNDVMSVDIVIEAPEGTPEDAEIWYSIDGNDPVKYNGEFNYAEDGNHTIEAWVVVKDTDANVEPNSIDVEGKKEQASFEIGIGTNVNELVNGKQIAGVRYFNMAGQEMQEANGITIVVTTYTDGTTSTVKVMK